MAQAALLLTEDPPTATLVAPEPVPVAEAVPLRPPAPAPVERRLEIPPYDLEAALMLQRELGVGRVLAQVLVRRGLADPTLARKFLEAAESHDPGCFDGIEHAVQTIRRHLDHGGQIVVHGDYDVDGVCATAIMVRALRHLGGNVRWFIPGRLEDGYGVSLTTIERLAERGTQLLITVDCGVTAVEEVAAATAGGMEVIVTDHHAQRPDGVLPQCPLVHPRLCGYPCPDLCGTAVAFKLAQALGAPALEDELELVALATVADLMPLLGENRHLVRAGIAALRNTTRPGLRALLGTSRTDPSELDAAALGFRLAPRINAAGRLRRADAALELLLTDDPERAQEIATELEVVNAERRGVEQRILWQAEAQVAELGERPAYVLAGEDWHPGVIGIVASRIVERFHRPTILIALGEDGTAQGSGRSIPGFDLLAGLHAVAPHLLRYGGHRAAAGLTTTANAVPLLRGAFEAHAREVLTAEQLVPVERVDAVACGSELGLDLAEELAQLEPCGIGNPRVRVLVPGARFRDVRAMGEGRHARFTVTSGGARARAVAFGCDGRVPGQDGTPVDATFALERNVWNGAVEPRLLLRHARPCAPPPIRVLGEPADYVQAALGELDRDLEAAAPPVDAAVARAVLDRRGLSPLSALADAMCAGGDVLAVCSDVGRRLPGLSARTGGFVLTTYTALGEDPSRSAGFAHIVALDPPVDATAAAALKAGQGYAVLAWGEAELRFVQQMHEHEYDLRRSLAALYRGVKAVGVAAGSELERLLRGDGVHPRSAHVAGRLIRVLAELRLISVKPGIPAVALASESPTSLERSPAFRIYTQRHQDGQRFLSSENPPLLV